MASDKLKILFVPEDNMMGPFNACIGIASVLRDRGHVVTFAASTKWAGKLKIQGFQEELFTGPDEELNAKGEAGDTFGDWITAIAPVLAQPTIKFHEAIYSKMLEETTKMIIHTNDQFKAIVARVQPDVLVLDLCQHVPALMDAGIPWILSISLTPLGITGENAPPACSGYPTEGDKNAWKLYDEEVARVYKNSDAEFNDWLVSQGSRPMKRQFPFMMDFSPYANIYMYPDELDYTPFRPNPPNFYQFSSFVRKCTETFEIPEKLKNGPGKLIYFSMGTIGCCEIRLMKKLISFLAKSQNRFIVAKGWKGDELELSDNMWGDKYLPQLAILPKVDLVITHGGNNSVTECFYFGRRVLVLPILFDQPDNSQRIVETGLGLAFHPYKVSEEELLNGIETLLADDLLQRRMNAISRRMQSSNSQSKAADLVEQVARKQKIQL